MSRTPQRQTVILDTLRRLLASGQVRTAQQLRQEYRAFRERFGPEVLKRLSGPKLLQAMWNLGNRDSLLYWLDQGDYGMNNRAAFGLIGGGAQPARFRLYRRAGSDVWVFGPSKKNARELTRHEAVIVATRFRDQLIKAATAIEAMPEMGEDADYRALQERLEEEAPDLVGLAWVHKYLHMLRPEVLDDYHVPRLQRQHLLWLGETPPKGKGRYLCGGRFARIARQLGIPMNHLAAAINRCDPGEKK